ncbi:porin family protein [Piscinibacter aquaticus]|uniref:Porin family protein n=1 Tax=Piscinibacter aquaticus TaxID=392597 RepID=A0A5C6U3K8_9BURK|nr:porin family protein [Piscinibacter aquaticus]
MRLRTSLTKADKRSLSMKKIANALLCVSMLGAAAAHAEGLSVGGSLASTKWKGDDIGGLSTDKSATGGKIYGGYSFTPNFGLEAGYATFGKYKSAAGSVKADGFFADAVGTLPLGNGFSALGRVGVFNGKLDSSRPATTAAPATRSAPACSTTSTRGSASAASGNATASTRWARSRTPTCTRSA